MGKEVVALMKNIHRGERAFIIGNGPSLDLYDLRRLRSDPILSSGVWFPGIMSAVILWSSASTLLRYPIWHVDINSLNYNILLNQSFKRIRRERFGRAGLLPMLPCSWLSLWGLRLSTKLDLFQEVTWKSLRL